MVNTYEKVVMVVIAVVRVPGTLSSSVLMR